MATYPVYSKAVGTDILLHHYRCTGKLTHRVSPPQHWKQRNKHCLHMNCTTFVLMHYLKDLKKKTQQSMHTCHVDQEGFKQRTQSFSWNVYNASTMLTCLRKTAIQQLFIIHVNKLRLNITRSEENVMQRKQWFHLSFSTKVSHCNLLDHHVSNVGSNSAWLHSQEWQGTQTEPQTALQAKTGRVTPDHKGRAIKGKGTKSGKMQTIGLWEKSKSTQGNSHS